MQISDLTIDFGNAFIDKLVLIGEAFASSLDSWCRSAGLTQNEKQSLLYFLFQEVESNSIGSNVKAAKGVRLCFSLAILSRGRRWVSKPSNLSDVDLVYASAVDKVIRQAFRESLPSMFKAYTDTLKVYAKRVPAATSGEIPSDMSEVFLSRFLRDTLPTTSSRFSSPRVLVLALAVLGV